MRVGMSVSNAFDVDFLTWSKCNNFITRSRFLAVSHSLAKECLRLSQSWTSFLYPSQSWNEKKSLLHNFIILHFPLISLLFVVRSPYGFKCHFYFSSIHFHAIRNHFPLIRIIFRIKWNSTHKNHSRDDRNSVRHQPNISSFSFSFY